VPIILAYTGYSYWVFRGKTGPEGYHWCRRRGNGCGFLACGLRASASPPWSVTE